MDNTKKQIADILSQMQFERRSPVSKQTKAQFAAMEAGLSDALKELSKLRLRVWHAVSQRDYHSLSLDEAKQKLDEVQRQISILSQAFERGK
jgi:uncharacterized membrane protein YgaE (UPF0421/DUF939 family)